MDANTLYSRLKESYRNQQEYYDELIVIAQKISGKLDISRGDVTSVMNMFQDKVVILDKINSERIAIKECVDEWPEKKSDLPKDKRDDIESVLSKVEVSIKKFMDAEERLKSFMESL